MKNKLTAILVALPFLSIAQSNFKPGYLITNQLDTLKGLISYKERTFSPRSFSFKTANDTAQTYTVENAAAFGIEGSESFNRYLVKISMSSVDVENLSEGLDTTSKTEMVFLGKLYEGKNASLYAFQDVIKKRYFIQRGTGTPEELKRSVYSKPGQSSTTTSNLFRNQLQAMDVDLHPGESVSQRKWARINYQEDELINAVASLNDQEKVESKYPSSRYYLGLGANVSHATYTGNHELAGASATQKNYVLPFVTAGVDIFGNPRTRKFVYRLELSFLARQYQINRFVQHSTGTYAASTSNTHDLRQYTLSVAPTLLYNVYNTSATKAYVGGGLSLDISTYTKNEIFKETISEYYGSSSTLVKDQYAIEKGNVAPHLRAGAVFHKRFEFALGYVFPSAVTSLPSFSLKQQRITAGINYHLGKGY